MIKFTKNANSYLIGIVFTLVLTCIYSVPAWPLLIKYFVAFPTLSQAKVYEGTLEFEGVSKANKFGNSVPEYYINTKDTRQKIFWGYIGSEDDRFLSEKIFYGTPAKVWFHPVFGVIQEEFTVTPDLARKITGLRGKTKFGNNYQDGIYDTFTNHFNYNKYKWAAFPSIVGFLLTIYYFIQYRRAKLNKNGD